MAHTHTVMPKKLAMALMEHGMRHYDLGGFISDPIGSLLGGNKTNPVSANINPGTNPDQISASYNQAQNAIGNTQGLATALQPQSTSAINTQNALAQMLLARSQGQGPNPAQAMLNQNTGTNVSNQAALMAGQRGASVNPGLIAKLAAQQGAGIQQNAVGQGASLEAQQEIAAQNQLQQLAGNQINQTAEGNAAFNQAAQNEQGILQGANTAANQAAVGMQSNVNTTNADLAKGRAGLIGGLAGAIPDIADMFGGIDTSGIGDFFGGAASSLGGAAAGAGSAITAGGAADSVGEAAPALLASKGAMVPGKAKVKGNSPENDNVPALLSPGEVVLPRSVTQSENPEKKAIEFLKHLKLIKGEKKDEGYAKVANAKKSLKERVEALEKCMGGKV